MRTEKIHECGLFMIRENAVAYCGLGVTRFNELVAPNVPQYKITPARGTINQTIHYAKDDLDRWYQLFREHMTRSDPEVASVAERQERGEPKAWSTASRRKGDAKCRPREKRLGASPRTDEEQS